MSSQPAIIKNEAVSDSTPLSTSSPPTSPPQQGGGVPGGILLNRTGKGLVLDRVKLSLDIDFPHKSLKGYSEIYFKNLVSKKISEIKVNSRQCNIQKVVVNGLDAEFELRNYLEQVVPQEDVYNVSIDNYNDFYKSAAVASDDGELIIKVPDLESSLQSQELLKEEQVVIRIYYTLCNPKGGVYFITPDNASYPNRIPHMFTHNQVCGARMWFPCLDNLNDRACFDMEYTVHSSLVVVSTGELEKQTLSPDRSKKTFYYKLDVPSLANCIAFTVAPYAIVSAAELDTEGKSKLGNIGTFFCLPNRQKELASSVSFLLEAFDYYEEYLGSPFPMKSFKIAFVEEAYAEISSYTSLAICSTHLLHDDTIIDQTFETRRLLSLSLALQWFGNLINARSWSESWICLGLAGYLSMLFFRKMFGQNEYRFRLHQDAEYVALHDNGPPLNNTSYTHPFEILQSKVARKKATLVMYIAERLVGAEGFRKVLSHLVSPSAMGEGGLDRSLTVKKLIKIIHKITGHNLKLFFQRWADGRGCPNLTGAFLFNKKKHVIELALKQNKPSTGTRGPIPGSMVVRVHEIDGDSYDHVITFDEELHSYELRCNSRVRKARKKKKDKGDDSAAQEEEDDPKKNLTPVLWVRLDPDLDSIRSITMRQPEAMWIAQLQQDPDMLAQYEAVDALQNFVQNIASITALNQVLCDPHCFYRIRMHAAHVMSKCYSPGVEWLLKFYKTKYFTAEGNHVKPNDFSDFAAYFIQKATQEAISNAKGTDGSTPVDIVEFVMDLLKNNDNSQNYYSENYFVASLLHSVVNVVSARDTKSIKKVLKQIERFLSIEKILPSYHNTVTIACLEALCNMQVARKIPFNVDKFKEYTKYGHYEEVRLTAIRCLIRLGIATFNTKAFLLDLLENEKVPRIRAKIAELLAFPTDVDEASHFSAFQKESAENIDLAKRLWLLLNSAETAYDCRFRFQVAQLYQRIWGNGIPHVFGNRDPAKLFANVGLVKSVQPQKRKANELSAQPSRETLKIILKKPDLMSPRADMTPIDVDQAFDKKGPPTPVAVVASPPLEEDVKQAPKKHRVEPPTPKDTAPKEAPKESQKDSLTVKIPKDKLLLARKNTKENISNGTPLTITELSPPMVSGTLTIKPQASKFSKVRIRIQDESLMVKELNKT